VHFLPFGGELVEVLIGGLKDLMNLRALDASPDRVLAVGQINGAIGPEIDNHLSRADERVNVTRLVVLRPDLEVYLADL